MKSSSGGLAHQDRDRPRIGALALLLANEVWTTSASASQIAYDAGLRDAEIEAALSVYGQNVATYRQTVLTAFQQMKDQLVAIRILECQQKVADDAVKAAPPTQSRFQKHPIGVRFICCPYLWRSVDAEGEVLDVLVHRRNKKHAVSMITQTGPLIFAQKGPR